MASLTEWTNQFDFWFDEQAHGGQNAVVVLRETENVAVAQARFERLTLIEVVPVERFGQYISAFHFYLGEGYIPPPPETQPF